MNAGALIVQMFLLFVVAIGAGAGEPDPVDAAFAGLGESAELVIIADDPAGLFDGHGTALLSTLDRTGLISGTLTAWDDFAQQIGLDTDEAAAALLSRRVVLIVEDDRGDEHWALLLDVDTPAEQRLRKRLHAAPRQRKDDHPVLAVEDGRYELAFVPDRAAERTTMVLAPSGVGALFDRALDRVLSSRTAPGDVWPRVDRSAVRVYARSGSTGSSLAGGLRRTPTGWRGEVSLSWPLKLNPSTLHALLAEPGGEHQAFGAIIPTGLLPRLRLRLEDMSVSIVPQSADKAWSAFVSGWLIESDDERAPPRLGLEIVIPARTGDDDELRSLDAEVGRWIALANPIHRLGDVPLKAGVQGPDFGGAFPHALRTHTVHIPHGDMGARFGRRVDVAWRYAFEAGNDRALALLVVTRPLGRASSRIAAERLNTRLAGNGSVRSASPVISAGFVRPRLLARVPAMGSVFGMLDGIERIAWRLGPSGDGRLSGWVEIDAGSLGEPRTPEVAGP